MYVSQTKKLSINYVCQENLHFKISKKKDKIQFADFFMYDLTYGVNISITHVCMLMEENYVLNFEKHKLEFKG